MGSSQPPGISAKDARDEALNGEAEALLESGAGTCNDAQRCAVLSIGGMFCSNCSSAVEKALNRLPEVQKCEVDLINEKATIRYDSSDAFEAQTLCEEVE